MTPIEGMVSAKTCKETRLYLDQSQDLGPPVSLTAVQFLTQLHVTYLLQLCFVGVVDSLPQSIEPMVDEEEDSIKSWNVFEYIHTVIITSWSDEKHPKIDKSRYVLIDLAELPYLLQTRTPAQGSSTC